MYIKIRHALAYMRNGYKLPLATTYDTYLRSNLKCSHLQQLMTYILAETCDIEILH